MDPEDIIFGGIFGLILSVLIGPFLAKKVDTPQMVNNAVNKHVERLQAEMEAEAAQTATA
jgi:hypothetical protein